MIKSSALPVLKRFLGTDDGLDIKVCITCQKLATLVIFAENSMLTVPTAVISLDHISLIINYYTIAYFFFMLIT